MKRLWSNGQGQGKGTARKEDGFAALFRLLLKVSTGEAVRNFPYWHLDLNAGVGWNDKAGCPGSPLVFLREAARVGRPCRAYFCDNDPEAAGRLQANVLAEGAPPEGSERHVVCCDNADLLARVGAEIAADERVPELAVGSCVCDPNGFRQWFPVGGLVDFFDRFRRIDCILNLNTSLFARVEGCKRSANAAIRKGFEDWPELGELLGGFHKQTCFIRNPSKGGGGRERFVTFLGTNARIKRTPFKDFYPLDSWQGQEIVRTLRRVDVGQGYLFE